MQQYLSIIDKDIEASFALLEKWANINSYSYNLKGLAAMTEAVTKEFKAKFKNLTIEETPLTKHSFIDDKANEINIELGKVLSIKKSSVKPGAINILLMGHLDTVYPENSSFQTCKYIDKLTLNGPGVSDLKGGLLVMIKALEALEASPYADSINWHVLLNPDEEIGSVGSQKLFPELAKQNQLALIYEPSLKDGSIAYKRKGTGNFNLVIRGRSAHVGRDFAKGVSAVVAAAEFINELNKFNSDSVIINFGKINGGGPLNVVPDLLALGINIRIETLEDGTKMEENLAELINKFNSREGLEMKIYGNFNRKPKIPDQRIDRLYEAIASCAQELGQNIYKKNTGGCCDGNNLWEHGLVNLDSLGVRGDNIHSPNEYVCLDSIAERAKLSALFLMKLAAGELTL